MHADEVLSVAEAMGQDVVAVSPLAGGLSHETSLISLADGQVVARVGGPDPEIEAAVMAAGRRRVPVPEVLWVGRPGRRPVMVVEYVEGTLLSHVLAEWAEALGELGVEVGRVVAEIGAVSFERPGFFVDESLDPRWERPWSRQLPEVAEACMASTSRLDARTRRAWVDLCVAHAPALRGIDEQARLVHADINPKNILVTRAGGTWRVDAVLDWEFAYSGCPYGDAANMVRFGDDYPAEFVAGRRSGFADGAPDAPEDWEYVGWVLDMFALSDLVTRPPGNAIADQAAALIRDRVTGGVTWPG
ncbi:phosphotransferase [Actinomadura barringtoniae]|uniref:Phosphotransferase n=1 Tax=Actinomadura barringtoniae TaxID=1427535 RepID=A0A939PEP8_9ACTN|nr:phosphotransferase [Actinomadura barringtoniae]MBO2448334.1 phosphotransferase [Actinomadura barringtoniae]